MSKRPSFQFYPGDWLRDSVAGCSLAAQGLWLRVMILAHDTVFLECAPEASLYPCFAVFAYLPRSSQQPACDHVIGRDRTGSAAINTNLASVFLIHADPVYR
jgi:hypothetical protein